jgi:hypothetical protein
MKKLWIACGSVIGLTSLSITMAAVPPTRSVVTDDTAIYQHLSEIKVSRESRPNFDGDIARLSSLESGYREKLPSLKGARDPRLSGPMKRIASQPYHYSATSAPARKKNSVASNE